MDDPLVVLPGARAVDRTSGTELVQEQSQTQDLGDILGRRIERGLIVVSRETIPDGTQRVGYRNFLP